MTSFLLVLVLAAAAVAVVLLALVVARVVAGDGALDVLGHRRRPTTASLPRSHRDPFDPLTTSHAGLRPLL